MVPEKFNVKQASSYRENGPESKVLIAIIMPVGLYMLIFVCCVVC